NRERQEMIGTGAVGDAGRQRLDRPSATATFFPSARRGRLLECPSIEGVWNRADHVPNTFFTPCATAQPTDRSRRPESAKQVAKPEIGFRARREAVGDCGGALDKEAPTTRRFACGM